MIKVLAAMRDAEDVVELREHIVRGLAMCGIESVYFVAPLTADPRLGRVIYSENVSPLWMRHYRAGLYKIDPLPMLALDYPNAFFWPDDLESRALTSQQSRYLALAARHGLDRGIGIACYGPHGRAGFFGGVWTRPERPSDAVMFAIHQIGQTSFQRYCLVMREGLEFEPLSARELEVLAWMCQGKSNPDMAVILGVSRSSIDQYIRRIFAKLDVTDRTAACVRAFSLGLVASDDMSRLIERARAQ